MARLNPVTVQKAKPRAARYEIGDDARPGFRLAVQPSGTRTFVFRYWRDGAPHKLTLGQYPALSFDRALELYREAADKLDKGGHPVADQRKGVTGDPDKTVTARIEQYKASNFLKVAADTAAYKTRELDRLAAAFGNKPAADVALDHVTPLIEAAARERGLSSAVTLHKVVKAFFGWLAQQGYIPASPLAALKPPSVYVPRERILDDSELAAIWRAAVKIGGPCGRFIRLLTLTACRRDEIARLERAELNGDFITIAGTRTKNGQAHSIFVTPEVRAVLADCPAAGRFLVTGNDAGLGGHSKCKAKLDKACGVANWTFHDLRRTAATRMIELGVSVPVVETVLNHTSGTRSNVLVRAYQKHKYAAEARDAWEKWSQYVARVVA